DPGAGNSMSALGHFRRADRVDIVGRRRSDGASPPTGIDMRDHHVLRSLTRVACVLFLVSCSEASTSPDPNPAPSVSSTIPGSVTVGVAPVSVSVLGTGFMSGSRVQVNGVYRPT